MPFEGGASPKISTHSIEEGKPYTALTFTHYHVLFYLHTTNTTKFIPDLMIYHLVHSVSKRWGRGKYMFHVFRKFYGIK